MRPDMSLTTPGDVVSSKGFAGDVGGLGTRIATRRRQLGLRQLEVATLAGLSEAYVNRLENGVVRNPKIQHVAAIAEALGLPLVALLYGEAPRTDDELLADLGRQPRLLLALTSLVRGLEQADPADREFVIGHLESLARRFGRNGEPESDSDA
jgi:transcriptional regulator with XRE-family HTH domain